MNVKSINRGKIKDYAWGKGVKSAIHKTPVTKLVLLSFTGLEGDQQADLNSHGGLEKALLIIPTDNYDFFNIDQQFGFLGENLSISSIDEYRLQIGDRLVIGEVVLEITQPRSPCAKLGEHSGRKTFVKEYCSSGRVGFYCRVIEQGKIQAGTRVSIIKTNENSVTIADLFLAQFTRKKTEYDILNIKTALATTTLSKAWRTKLSKIIL